MGSLSVQSVQVQGAIDAGWAVRSLRAALCAQGSQGQAEGGVTFQDWLLACPNGQGGAILAAMRALVDAWDTPVPNTPDDSDAWENWLEQKPSGITAERLADDMADLAGELD